MDLRAVLDVPRFRWERVGSSRREELVRGALSFVAFAGGVLALIAAITSPGGEGNGRFWWPGTTLFVAWRFLRLGLYTSDWGVRICNPVFTYWYPWRKIDHFELVSTGEMFAPKAQAIAVVSTRRTTQPALGLSTSRLFVHLTKERQAELLADLNVRAAPREDALRT